MQFFYDGQIRRYLTQTIRVFSNFVVKYGDGTLVRVPVMYGDADRQAASIIRNNSENKVNSVPRISVYISGLDLDKDRLSDSSYVGKVNIRERDVDGNAYTNNQGRNYTVERLMPTPFKLTMKVDIWSANTEQKLQIMEQLLVLFNPSLELQTSDNYLDWTSLTVLNLSSINWTSKSVPVGVDTPIEIGTLTVDTPIWINPPVKVKHLGVIQKIVTSLWNHTDTTDSGYIEGLGADLSGGGTPVFRDLLSRDVVTVNNFTIMVYNAQARVLGNGENAIPREPTLEIPQRQGANINWQTVFDNTSGKYIAGISKIFLTQPNGTEVVGTIAINSLDNSILTIDYDPDTLVTNTGIDSQGYLDTDVLHYNKSTNYRSSSPGTFDAIINPQTYNPKRPTGRETVDQTVTAGRRFLIVEDVGSADNAAPASAWGALIAKANDIIEWTGTQWHVIFNSNQETTTMVWQTNIYTGVQYLWNGVSWVKSFEGEYMVGQWRIEL
jgi:hypothetical protein